jgi:hypothetical protein
VHGLCSRKPLQWVNFNFPQLRFAIRRATLGIMPKRTSKPKLDTVQNARRVVDFTIEQSEVSLTVVSQVMAQMGRKGGKIGGKRRLETLTDKQRSEIASIAAKARWSKKRKAS